MSIALLIIDMQKEYKSMVNIKMAVEYINKTSKIFRESGQPVIIILDTEIGIEYPGFQLMEEINRYDTDIVVHKEFCNSFWKTELDEILKSKKIQYVVISGFAAEQCVLFTYNGALERDYKASILQNGVAGHDINEIKNLQLLRSVISINTLNYLFQKCK